MQHDNIIVVTKQTPEKGCCIVCGADEIVKTLDIKNTDSKFINDKFGFCNNCLNLINKKSEFLDSVNYEVKDIIIKFDKTNSTFSIKIENKFYNLSKKEAVAFQTILVKVLEEKKTNFICST